MRTPAINNSQIINKQLYPDTYLDTTNQSDINTFNNETEAVMPTKEEKAFNQAQTLQFKEYIKKTDPSKWTITKLKSLIKKNTDINTDIDGENVLAIAYQGANMKVFNFLIKSGANPNSLYNKKTILAEAVHNQNTQVVEALLNGGANPNLLTNYQNPLVWTAINLSLCGTAEEPKAIYRDILKILVKSGVNIEVKNNRGDTPLRDAVKTSNVEVAEILLNGGAKMDTKQDKEDQILAGERHTTDKLAKKKAKGKYVSKGVNYQERLINAQIIFRLFEIEKLKRQKEMLKTNNSPFHNIVKKIKTITK